MFEHANQRCSLLFGSYCVFKSTRNSSGNSKRIPSRCNVSAQDSFREFSLGKKQETSTFSLCTQRFHNSEYNPMQVRISDKHYYKYMYVEKCQIINVLHFVHKHMTRDPNIPFCRINYNVIEIMMLNCSNTLIARMYV